MPINPRPFALALALLAAPVFAQETQDAEQALSKNNGAPKTSFSLTFDTHYSSSANFDTFAGDLSISRLKASLGVRHTINPKLALKFGASVEQSFYDFSGATGFIAGTGDPFDDVTMATLGLGFDYKSNDTDTWIFGGFVRTTGESGADFSETIDGGIQLGYKHKFSDTLTLGGVINVGTELEDDIYAIPVPLIDWKITDKWHLVTDDQANVQIRYEYSDEWTFGLQGGYERREIRLDETGPSPSGIVDERRVPVALFATYTPGPHFVITGSIGTSLVNNYEFTNLRDNFISEDDADPSLALGLSLTLQF